MKEHVTPSDNSACTLRECQVSSRDLPLSCPLPKDRVWNAHPRVYLPIAETGREICPYCGTIYILTDFAELQALDTNE